MSDPNVFRRLFSYRPRENRVSEEDFLTEAYAAVLLADKEAAAGLLNNLYSLHLGDRRFTRDFELLTQRTYKLEDGGSATMWLRPDMEFRDDGIRVFQENKAHASFDAVQIQNYARVLQAHRDGSTSFVVSCTGVPVSDEVDERHLAIQWSSVYRAMTARKDAVSQGARALWGHFLEFLIDMNMNSFEGLERQCLDSLRGVAVLRQRLRRLMRQLDDHITADYGLMRSQRELPDNRYVTSIFECPNGLQLQLCIEFDHYDSRGLEIQLDWKPESAPDVLDRVRQVASSFRERPYSHYGVARALPEIDQQFFERSPESQVDVLNSWIRQALQPFVEAHLIERRRRGDWGAFIRWICDQLDRTSEVVLTLDEIIEKTGSRDRAVRSRSFWLNNQRGAAEYDGFSTIGITVDFSPDAPTLEVQSVRFSRSLTA